MKNATIPIRITWITSTLNPGANIRLLDACKEAGVELHDERLVREIWDNLRAAKTRQLHDANRRRLEHKAKHDEAVAEMKAIMADFPTHTLDIKED